MSDRWIHDLMSVSIAGKKNRRKDQCLDVGSKEYGSRHRNHFPHRNIQEATLYMTVQDIIAGRTPDPATNLKLAIGHFTVDKIPTRMKKILEMMQ